MYKSASINDIASWRARDKPKATYNVKKTKFKKIKPKLFHKHVYIT